VGQVFNDMAGNIAHIFSKKDLAFPAGQNARKLRDCVTAVYRQQPKFAGVGLPRLSVWYASLGTFKPSSHRARQDAAIAQLMAVGRFAAVEVQAAGAHELRDFYHDLAGTTSAKFTMSTYAELPPMPGVKRAVIGALPAKELVDKILTDAKGLRRQWLFDDNMRNFLEQTGTRSTPVSRQLCSTSGYVGGSQD
jgi:hypothetical protein